MFATRRAWILAACVACSSAHAASTVCIDTNPTTSLVTRTMRVAVSAGGPANVVFGAVTAIDATGQVTFDLPTGAQTARPASIAIEVPPPSMMAQMAPPTKESLGPQHARIAFKDVSVKSGVVVYPQCVAAQPDHAVAFVGTLRFEKDALVIDGEAFDVRAAEQSSPNGSRKPGA